MRGSDSSTSCSLVQQELLLDIEVAANAAQPLGAPSLEAFDELLAGFADVAEHPTLGAFLGWLTEAEQRDRLAPRQDEPEPGAVQVLSIHGSKGLEWDVVAIPRLVDDELPSKPRTTKGWLAFGELPNEFKGDRDELPELQWRGVQSQAEFDQAVRAFADENRERHADEERRLAYVALTRTRRELLLTGRGGRSQKAPRKPSTFLRELVQAGILDPAVLPDRARRATRTRAPATASAPALAARPARSATHAGARRSRRRAGRRRSGRAARASAPGSPTSSACSSKSVADGSRGPAPRRSPPACPRRGSRTTSTTPPRSPSSCAGRCRSAPIRATRIGTLFHAVGRAPLDRRGRRLGDRRLDVARARRRGPTRPRRASRSTDATAERLRALQATFEASEWGGRKPIAVELELHLPIDEHVFVCKLDAVYDVRPDGELGGPRHPRTRSSTGRPARHRATRTTSSSSRPSSRSTGSRTRHWAGVDPDAVDAVFYFVEDDRVIRPERLYDEAALRRSWASVAAVRRRPRADVAAEPAVRVGAAPRRPSR